MLIGAGLLCLSMVMALSVIGVITSERRGVARSVAAIQAMDSAPSVLKAEVERPFAERIIAPLGERMVGLGRKLVRADTARKIQYRLNIAGNPPAWDVNRILGLKVLGARRLHRAGLLLPARPALAALQAGPGDRRQPASSATSCPTSCSTTPARSASSSCATRCPDAMDLLTISVEAGLGFDAAVSRVAKNGDGPLNQEFARLLQEMQLGRGRTEAMRAMAERTSLADLKSFCLAMVQADSLGIPIARVLRIQSKEMRTKRRQRAEEKAQQVPIRMMIPLVLFILPCLFIVILGPAGIQIADTFANM